MPVKINVASGNPYREEDGRFGVAPPEDLFSEVNRLAETKSSEDLRLEAAEREARKASGADDRSTWDTFRDPVTGQWTEERQKIHEEIKRKIISGEYEADQRRKRGQEELPTPTPQDSPEAFILGGGAASGKSTVVNGGLVHFPDNRVVVNSDDIKSMLPEWADRFDNKGIASLLHDESSYLSKLIAGEAADNNYNVVLDGTGNNVWDSLVRKINILKGNGMPVHGVYVTVNEDEAWRRADLRAQSSGRNIFEFIVRNGHRGVSKVFPEIVSRGAFNTWVLFDNNGDKPILIAEGGGTEITVFAPALYQQFLAKADRTD